MAYYEDLSPCDYFGQQHADSLLSIGWLTCSQEFQTGPTDAAIYAKLKELLKDCFTPFAFGGGHNCEICQFDSPIGYSNLFVPNGNAIYVCPELILHYVATHSYQPPAEFVVALHDCPDTRTMQYKKLLLSSGGRNLVRKTG